MNPHMDEAVSKVLHELTDTDEALLGRLMALNEAWPELSSALAHLVVTDIEASAGIPASFQH